MNHLDIHYEDVLLKIFMYSLEGNAKQWCQSLPISSISSIKYFHAVFYDYCKRIYFADLLLEDYCEQLKFKKYLSNNDQHSITDEIHEEIFHCEAQSSIEENIENHTVYEGLQDNVKIGVDDNLIVNSMNMFNNCSHNEITVLFFYEDKKQSIIFEVCANSSISKRKFQDCCDAQGVDSYDAKDIISVVSAAPNIYENHPCIEGIIVEAFGSTNFSCFHDDMMSQKTFQDLLNEEKHELSASSLEYYQAAPIFDEYGDDLKIQDPDGCDVAKSN